MEIITDDLDWDVSSGVISEGRISRRLLNQRGVVLAGSIS